MFSQLTQFLRLTIRGHQNLTIQIVLWQNDNYDVYMSLYGICTTVHVHVVLQHTRHRYIQTLLGCAKQRQAINIQIKHIMIKITKQG